MHQPDLTAYKFFDVWILLVICRRSIYKYLPIHIILSNPLLSAPPTRRIGAVSLLQQSLISPSPSSFDQIQQNPTHNLPLSETLYSNHTSLPSPIVLSYPYSISSMSAFLIWDPTQAINNPHQPNTQQSPRPTTPSKSMQIAPPPNHHTLLDMYDHETGRRNPHPSIRRMAD
jgi:hypothetical protein